MHSRAANADSRLSFWQSVREFAVPPSMIERATARRRVGDWAGACAAARVDADINLRALAGRHGRELAARVRADLRQLAPDLLRWHLPRVAPDGLLRPGLIVSLSRYDPERPGGGPVHLVARTPPAWADAGQRISLGLWDGSRRGSGAHPHPDRRFRLDLHRHLWDARRAGELRTRSGADRLPWDTPASVVPDEWGGAARASGHATDRWVAEAALLLRAEGRTGGAVTVRLGGGRRLVLEVAPAGHDESPSARVSQSGGPGLPVLPDAATWVLPDLALLRAGLVEADRLHPLVASALVPEHPVSTGPTAPKRAELPRLVPCRGALHRIGLVGGVLAALDHDPAEIRREELLAALTGTPLPCLRAIDEAHRQPDCLPDVRARLDHGDAAGALATVEALLGPKALLRDGSLRDELETAAQRRITHGLFRAGLIGAERGPTAPEPRRSGARRQRSRHATNR
ncbi:hypothetical protein [Micromonospora lupini]|uniref:Uncharacterized protein n=1 Tax=Micromonospora lupini str. Lupac 08 TaxID=1150864 RepID=I0L635_9ACTN|nr:hypothetical protein [Micromonospora lupini]CCH19282.1 Conserved hypothetical protein [Micromonospora lupini str. Lupac 08]